MSYSRIKLLFPGNTFLRRRKQTGRPDWPGLLHNRGTGHEKKKSGMDGGRGGRDRHVRSLSIGLHREEQKIQQEIAASVVRFHVKANSDTRKDQDNKLAVRDALLEKMEELLDENSDSDKEETEKILRRHLPELETCAEKVLRERNCSQSVEVSFGESWFPQKTYGDTPFRPATMKR